MLQLVPEPWLIRVSAVGDQKQIRKHINASILDRALGGFPLHFLVGRKHNFNELFNVGFIVHLCRKLVLGDCH